MQYATEIKDLLKPYCVRVEIAGGVRRKKQDPHDIELVTIPKITYENQGIDAFGFRYEIPIDNLQDYIHHSSTFQKGDPDKAGKKAPSGPKYYRLKYKGDKLVIFAVLPPATWPVIFTIRTGDADFSHWLVQQGFSRGLRVVDGHLEENGILIQLQDEREFLNKMIFTWVEPENRNNQFIEMFKTSTKVQVDRIRKMM